MNSLIAVFCLASLCVAVSGQGASGGTPANNNAGGGNNDMMNMMRMYGRGRAGLMSGGAAGGLASLLGGGAGGLGGAMGGMGGAMLFGGMDANNLLPFLMCQRMMPAFFCMSQYLN